MLEQELTALFLAAGVLGSLVFAPRSAPRTGNSAGLVLAIPVVGWASSTTTQLFVFFFKTGCLVFGSGLVIVPFLKTYVVDQYHWLGNREFLDAVAIGMISPGPVVITATFVGYLVGGFAGALAATVGIFSPAVLFTLLATPLLVRHRQNPRLQGFIRGVTDTVVGVLAGTTALVAQTALGDALAASLALASLLVFALRPDVPEPLLVAAGALVGLAVQR